MQEDSLGDRMKSQYENRAKVLLPRRTYTIIRIDGKAFHTYCRGLERPFDLQFMSDMDATMIHLCEGIQGVQLAYVQSDEISLLLTDFATVQTDAWFDGSVQKMASISASIATAQFNRLRIGADVPISIQRFACFDSRCFTIPDPVEVENYFIWRQNDATRNSIQMAGQANFSHKQLQRVDCNQIQEMLFSEKGINWNNYPEGFKRGRCAVKITETVPLIDLNPTTPKHVTGTIDRTKWKAMAPPVFTQGREFLSSRIPRIGEKQ